MKKHYWGWKKIKLHNTMYSIMWKQNVIGHDKKMSNQLWGCQPHKQVLMRSLGRTGVCSLSCFERTNPKAAFYILLVNIYISTLEFKLDLNLALPSELPSCHWHICLLAPIWPCVRQARTLLQLQKGWPVATMEKRLGYFCRKFCSLYLSEKVNFIH
jgi:hypothetical protein